MPVRLPSAAFLLALALTVFQVVDGLAQGGGPTGNRVLPNYGRGSYGGGRGHYGHHDNPFDDLNVGIILTPDWVNGWSSGPGGYYQGGYYPPSSGGYAQPVLDQPPFYYGQPAPNYYSAPPPAVWSQSQYFTPNQPATSQGASANQPSSTNPIANQRNSTLKQPSAQLATGADATGGHSLAPAYQPPAETPPQPQRRRSILIRPESDPTLAQTLAAGSSAQSEYSSSLASFAEGNYQAAADAARLAVEADDENGKLRLYLAQCQFAIGQYAESADSLTSAFQRLPREQWGLLIENFRQFYKRNDYVPQVERLLAFSEQPENRSLGLALQAYHYHYLGHPNAAAEQLRNALQESSPSPLALELKSLLLEESGTAAESLPAPALGN